jgi:hypothetical protein
MSIAFAAEGYSVINRSDLADLNAFVAVANQLSFRAATLRSVLAAGQAFTGEWGTARVIAFKTRHSASWHPQPGLAAWRRLHCC